MGSDSLSSSPFVKFLPEGWTVSKLHILCSKIGTGATPRGGQKVYLDDRISYALIRSQNVFDRFFDYSGLAFIDNEAAKKLSNAEVLTGDLLLNITGDGITFARSCMVPDSVLPACVNQHVAIIRTIEEQCASGYLLSVLTHPTMKEYVESFNAGGSRRAITKGHIESFEIPLPPLPEQKAIAHILGSLDDKIELNRRMNATLEGMAQALFQSWFVDFDPVLDNALAAGNPIPDELADRAAVRRQALANGTANRDAAQPFPANFQFTDELGWIPEGWDVEPLGGHLDVLETGRRPKGGVSKYTSGVPSVGAESIFGIGQFNFGKLKFVPEEFFKKMKSGKVESYDVLLYKDGGKPGEFKPRSGMYGEGFPFKSFGINEHVFRMRSSSLGQAFLYYQVSSERVFHHLAVRGGKAAIPGINQKEVNSVDFLVPQEEVREIFNNFSQPIFEKIMNAANQSRMLERLRDTLLPKLISGELRIPDAENLAEEALA